jgi:hypothetical protein
MALVDYPLRPPLSSSPHSHRKALKLILNPIFSVLHDQLIAAQQHLSPQTQETRPQPASARDQNNNIDPAISGGAMLGTAAAHPPSIGQVMPPQIVPGVQEAAAGGDADRKTYGKRELSTSKRAAQNRAAQVYAMYFQRWSSEIY